MHEMRWSAVKLMQQQQKIAPRVINLAFTGASGAPYGCAAASAWWAFRLSGSGEISKPRRL